MKEGGPGVSKRSVRSLSDIVDPPKGTQDDAELPRGRRILKKVLYWGKRGAVVLAAVLLVGILGIVFAVRHFEAQLPSIADLKGNYRPPQVTRIMARDGALLAELFTERRTVVPIGTLPPHVKLAVLAAEDAGFYEHEGLNYLGIARAFVVNMKSGKTRQGGSTITQQVVKNVLLDSERTYKRKVREALLSRKLEQELSKDEILELYLNHIYFGHGRYGIEEAARDNFGKHAKDVTIAEGAMLAGIVAGPELYSPRRDLKRSLSRRAFVLTQMHEKGFLNDAQYEAANNEAVHLAPSVTAYSELAPEVVEIARRALEELDHDGARRGGYTITTTIDPKLQAAARKALRDNLMAYDKRHGLSGAFKIPAPPPTAAKGKAAKPPTKDLPFEGTPNFDKHKVYIGVVSGADDAQGTIDVRVGTATGTVKLADFERYNPQKLAPSVFAPAGSYVRVSLLAAVPEEGKEGMAKVPLRVESGPEGALVAIDVRSRQVLALVGNYEAANGGLDRATQSRRQPGSTFKPIVYSYAIHSRIFTPATLVDVAPAKFGMYHPSNYEGWSQTDPLRLREVLANSVNVGAVRVLEQVGPANVVEWGHALGIQSTLKPDLSLALGSYEVHPIELCGAYATFAAGGTYEEPRIITRIVGPDGKELALKAPAPPRRVLDDAEAYVITNMMTSVIDHGTGARAKELRRPLAGKTGTSNQSKDTWFSGFSTEIATTVWVGYDDGKPLGSAESGAQTALPAWIAFMKAAHEGKPPSDFPRPAGVVSVKIDRQTGKLPFEGDTNVDDEVFLAGTEPTEVGNPVVVTGGDGGAALAPPPEEPKQAQGEP
jgi:penicillin-binding protein 1A